MCMEDLTPYLLKKVIQGCEVLCRLPTPFEGHHISNMGGIMAHARLLLVIRISSCPLLNI